MRRLIITQNVTINGVVESDGSWFDPTEDSEQGRELARLTQEHAAASDGFLVGRVTFGEMRRFWPTRVDDHTGVTDHLNRVQKYVVSSTLDDPEWEGTTVSAGETSCQNRSAPCSRRMERTSCSPAASPWRRSSCVSD